VDPSAQVLLNAATLARGDQNELMVELEFAHSVPPEVRVVSDQFGKPALAPGSVSMAIFVLPAHLPDEKLMVISTPQPAVARGWTVDVSTIDGADSIPPPAVSVDGDTLKIGVDVSGQEEFLGGGGFEADVELMTMIQNDALLRGDYSQPPFDAQKSQRCDWGTQPQRRSAPTAPAEAAPRPSAIALTPGQYGYVAIQTASGRTRCQIESERVICETAATNWPAHGVAIGPDGSIQFADGNLGDIRPVTIGYHRYTALGWTIDASEAGTRFTNDRTGRGADVSTEQVRPF
jgi:hypothetical protein